MNPDIFPPNNFHEISINEFYLLKKQLDSDIFSRFYKEGKSINLINSLELSPSKIYKLGPEKQIQLAYDFSLEQKERLMNYFGKEILNEKLSLKNEYFKTVTQQVKIIDNIIKPIFNDLGIDYKLHLTGGALRDHILNETQNVKDLDILIEFNDKLYVENMSGKNGYERRERQKEELKKFFEEKSSIIKKYKLDINVEQSREKIFHEIVFQSVKNFEGVEIKDFFLEQFQKENIEITQEQIKGKEVTPDDSVIYDGLFSVLKVKHANFKYPVDLLLNSNKYSYINNFDFDICKCAYTFENDKDSSSLYIYDGFIKDVIDKKLSLNAAIFYSEKQIDRCLKDHYLRLRKKYPEHEFTVLEKNTDSKFTSYIKKSHLFHVMEYKFPEKNNKIKTKKI